MKKDVNIYSFYDECYVSLLDFRKLQQENEILKENAKNNDKIVDNVNWENQLLKKENQELKNQLENNLKINIADHKYASECEDKVIVLETQKKDFIKYLETIIEQNIKK